MDFVYFCLVFIASLTAGRAQEGNTAACNGDFDFYLILDTSGSIRNDFNSSIIPFARQMADSFTNPRFRMSLITFEDPDKTVVHVPITSDRDAIHRAINGLYGLVLLGRTFLKPAITKVVSSIRNNGQSRSGVLLIVTDGFIEDFNGIPAEAAKAEDMGAIIVSVGIGAAQQEQLRILASFPSLVFHTSTASGLEALANEIAKVACTEVTGISRACFNSSIIMTGTGLNRTKNGSSAHCLFTNEGNMIKTYARQPLLINEFVCPVPSGIEVSGFWTLQISLNGITYLTATTTLEISDCITNPIDVSSGAGLGVGLFFLILLLIALIVGLVLLWLFFPCITGKIVGGLPPEEPKPKPEARPPKKWATVDASLYGGGGVGGIKPVTVRWGDKGATEEGNKLEKAKDAQVVAVHETPGYQPPPEKQPTCWDTFKAKVTRAYKWLASYRVYKGRTTRLVWFPGPKSVF